jgi:hypothetical protein
MDNSHHPARNLKIAVLIINWLTTVVLGLIVVLLPATTPLSVSFAILSINIVALFTTLQFFIEQKFVKYEMSIANLSDRIADMQKLISISEVYKKILTLDEEEKKYHWSNLKEMETKLNKFIRERRSGALARSVYYGKLNEAAEKIKENFKATNKSKYKGEIWAMSFWQNDEWNRDSNDYEDGWISVLEEMDKLGIKTVRIAVMSYKKEVLSREHIDSEVDNLINKIVDNCHDNRVRKNTSTLFVNDVAAELNKVVGKGFFAIKLDGNSKDNLLLIRGVSLDRLEGSDLEGELVFDPNEVRTIRAAWEQCRNTGKNPQEYFYRQYSNKNISSEVKSEMIKRGLDWF